MVLNKFGDRLYEGVTDSLRRHLASVAAMVVAAHGVDFLPDLHKRWQDHKTSLQMIRSVLRRRIWWRVTLTPLATPAQRHPHVHGPHLRDAARGHGHAAHPRAGPAAVERGGGAGAAHRCAHEQHAA